jgi:4-hydroxy-tetrahydrodipicolinate synthase
MHPAPLKKPLVGIVPPMLTPLESAERLDSGGLARLIRHLLEGGVHGVFILGTTGEGPSLPYALRRELIDRTCDEVAGRIPVLVGVTDTAFAESVAIARHAQRAGAAAVVIAPPPYFQLGQNELLGYLERFADASPLPVMLYNMPALTKVAIDVATVRAAADHPNIVGLKDSSGDLVYFHQVRRLLADREDFTLLVGPEELLAESVLLGGHGGVNGGANLAPELYVGLYEAALAENLDLVRRLHARVMALSAGLYGIAGGGASLIRSLKCALSLRGICRDGMCEPFVPVAAPDRQRVGDCLAGLDLDTPVGV